MLDCINVKNLALIKESEVRLGPGLNILTGETGAGKSIILGSIRLALGERAKADMIRTGEEYALIELVFTSKDDAVIEKMNELDLPIETDGTIILTRRLQEGKSTCKCNGETITGRALKELAGLLINIHGQNDTLDLLDSKNYMDILDEYDGEGILSLKEQLGEDYANLVELRDEFMREKSAEAGKEKDVSLARFEVEEINNARLADGEDEELEASYRTMTHGQRIAESLSKAYSALVTEGTASDQVGFAHREVENACAYDEGLNIIAETIAGIEDTIRDVSRDMQSYIDNMNFSQEEFRRIEERLDVINRLKSKYGDSIEAILEYAKERENFIDKMSNHDEYVAALEVKVAEANEKALKTARELSIARSKAAVSLRESMIENLKALNFQSVEFEVDVQADEKNLCGTGIDDVDFLVSFNLGEPVKSLASVASGGELSRFMLALKSVTADKDMVGTLIFDEIDAGISGATAWSVSEKMAYLAGEHQVIAITHLPQIAAMADNHYLIEKKVFNESTVTDICRLNDSDRLDEVARLLSAGEITDISRNGAKELLERAAEAKK